VVGPVRGRSCHPRARILKPDRPDSAFASARRWRFRAVARGRSRARQRRRRTVGSRTAAGFGLDSPHGADLSQGPSTAGRKPEQFLARVFPQAATTSQSRGNPDDSTSSTRHRRASVERPPWAGISAAALRAGSGKTVAASSSGQSDRALPSTSRLPAWQAEAELSKARGRDAAYNTVSTVGSRRIIVTSAAEHCHAPSGTSACHC